MYRRYIDKTSTVKTDEYTDIAEKIFDFKFNGTSSITIENNLRLPEDNWNIGIIHGPSGSGKSTIIKEIGEVQTVKWDSNAIISNFKENCSPEEAADMLSAVGLNSIPTWVRPYEVLSTGEKFRAYCARLLSSKQEDNQVVFEVTDKGKGIDKRYQSKVFDKYFQIPGSHKSGTGLGLAISKEFIEAQNGTIGVDSELGLGSTFYFRLNTV